MKIILVNGSPHEKGCTYTALNEIAVTLNKENIKTKILWLGSKPIGDCIGCNYCLKNNNRCFMNDIVNVFLDEVKEYDGFIFGSPVYFASSSGSISSFLDRVFYGRGEMFANKLCASVVSCRRGGASSTFDMLNKYALISNMTVVGSSYWNQVHGNKPEEVLKDLEGMQTMRNLALNMSYMLKCIEKGKEAGIKKPKYEKTIRTNFIRN